MISSPVKKKKEKLNNFQQAILIQLFAVPQNLYHHVQDYTRQLRNYYQKELCAAALLFGY